MRNPDAPPIRTPAEWERYAADIGGTYDELFEELLGQYHTLYRTYAALCRAVQTVRETPLGESEVADVAVRCWCHPPGSGGDACTGHCGGRDATD